MPQCRFSLELITLSMLPVATILSTTGLFSLIMLLVLASLMRSGVPGVREWFMANLLVVVAVLLLGLRGLVSDFLSIVAANTLLALAGSFYYAGCACFLHRKPYWPHLLSGVAALCGAMIFWRYRVDDITIRVFASSIFNTIMCGALGILLLRHRPRQDRPHRYMLGAALAGLFAALQIVRGAVFLHMPSIASLAILGTPLNLALLTVNAMTMPALTMLAVMMIHNAMMSKLKDAINHDHLTGCLSRKRFEMMAADTLRQASAAQPVSLLLIDLDHFKLINDTWGHAAGDEVLRSFAGMVVALIRPGDMLGRLGGEEFGVLLPQAPPSEAMVVAERLRQMAQDHAVSGSFGTCRYSISIGIAGTNAPQSIDHLSARADHALYEAKNNGRNQIVVAQMPALEMPDASSELAPEPAYLIH